MAEGTNTAKPTGSGKKSGGGDGILTAPGDNPSPSGPITVDPKSGKKAQLQNFKGGSHKGKK